MLIGLEHYHQSTSAGPRRIVGSPCFCRKFRVSKGRSRRTLDWNHLRVGESVEVSPEGKATTFIGVPSGGWFGEGTLLKNEPWPYDAVALRSSVVANVPRRTFFTLLERSVGFNRFLIVQLNERLGQFVAMVEHGRFLGPDARLAAELAALFNPVLYPGTQLTLLISQEELGQFVGLSRARL